MKKRNQIIYLCVVFLLFGCTQNAKEMPKKEKGVTVGDTGRDDAPLKNRPDSALVSIKKTGFAESYFYSTDSFCQTLTLKEIKLNKKLDIPDKLEFKLVLHDPLNKNADKVFEGVANLFSSEESFTDDSEKDAGDYFAADYDFSIATYNMIIRLDIEHYDACVISITTNSPSMLFGAFEPYIKKYPNYNVMKRGVCR